MPCRRRGAWRTTRAAPRPATAPGRRPPGPSRCRTTGSARPRPWPRTRAAASGRDDRGQDLAALLDIPCHRVQQGLDGLEPEGGADVLDELDHDLLVVEVEVGAVED